MKLELKKMESIDYDIFNFPNEIERFTVLITMSIGFQGQKEADNFNVRICSTKWILEHILYPEYMEHTIIVRDFNLSIITKEIERILEKCNHSDEKQAIRNLSRYFDWEFENYIA